MAGKTYLKTIIAAGPLRKECVRPIIQRGDKPEVRREKRQLTCEAVKHMNAEYSFQKLELQLAANYGEGDLWITPTYREGEEPKSEAEAEKNIKTFLRRFREARRKRGAELRCHWCTEHLHEHESFYEHRRWHHHMALNATGDDFDLIRRCWTWGDNIEIKKLHFGGADSYEALARYMCKERSEKGVGKHVWHHTRNIRKPEVESFRVEPDEPVQAPKGSTVLEEGSRRTRNGHYRYIKYQLPDSRADRPRSRRRDKRRR